MTDDLGLFGDTQAVAGRRGTQRRNTTHRDSSGRRGRRQARQRRRRRLVLVCALAVLGVAIAGAFIGVRKIQAWRDVPDYAGDGGPQAIVEVEDGQSLTAIGATLARQDVVASVRAFTRAADADPRVRAVQPGFY
ncbi:MAG: aminodeoxychorismate lyase, partial [Actinomycetota bacterium]|nr:aminodeoxychorismate lyase [Actinomycetota bacterium]